MGLHSASDGGGNPDEEEKEELCYPEAPGQGPPHTGEEPIERLSAGQDFQLQQIRVTAERLLDKTVVMEIWTRLNEMVKSSVADVMNSLIFCSLINSVVYPLISSGRGSHMCPTCEHAIRPFLAIFRRSK